jgi:hypothetical protein
MNLIDIKEKLAVGEPLTPPQRDFVLQCINDATTGKAEAAEALFDSGNYIAMTDRDGDPIDDVQFIVKAARAFLHPLLAGNAPEVQNMVIADLAATYLAGVAPPLRPEMRAIFINLIDDLVPLNERELFGDHGHPSK